MKINKQELYIKKKIYYKHIRLLNIYYFLSRKTKINDVSKLFHTFSYENHRYAEGIKAILANDNLSLSFLMQIYHQMDSQGVGLSAFFLGNTFLKYYLKRKEKEIIKLITLLPNDNTLFDEIKKCSEIHIEKIDSFVRIK